MATLGQFYAPSTNTLAQTNGSPQRFYIIIFLRKCTRSNEIDRNCCKLTEQRLFSFTSGRSDLLQHQIGKLDNNKSVLHNQNLLKKSARNATREQENNEVRGGENEEEKEREEEAAAKQQQ